MNYYNRKIEQIKNLNFSKMRSHPNSRILFMYFSADFSVKQARALPYNFIRNPEDLIYGETGQGHCHFVFNGNTINICFSEFLL